MAVQLSSPGPAVVEGRGKPRWRERTVGEPPFGAPRVAKEAGKDFDHISGMALTPLNRQLTEAPSVQDLLWIFFAKIKNICSSKFSPAD